MEKIIKMRIPKLTIKHYDNSLDRKTFHYYRLIGWYNFQLYLRGILFSLIIPARRIK